jgi:CubicO group peptidase (beta-lactamase class C family)
MPVARAESASQQALSVPGWSSDSLQVLWHNGGTGGFRSVLGCVKENEAGVVVLSNYARSVDAIGFRILEALSRA